jgi:hypothetical protein
VIEEVAMLRLTLPALVAGRDLADALVDKLEDDVPSAPVLVDASRLESGTSSFAAQLVRRLLLDRRADRLILFGAPASFAGYVRDAAVTLRVSNKLDTRDVATAG